MVIVVEITLGMLKLREEELRAAASVANPSADIFNLLSKLPSTVDDVASLFDASERVASTVDETMVASLRWSFDVLALRLRFGQNF